MESVNDIVWQAIIAGVVTIVLALIQVGSQYLAARYAVAKVAEVRKDLGVNTAVTKDTNQMVNGQRAEMLARIAALEAMLRQRPSEEGPHELLQGK